MHDCAYDHRAMSTAYRYAAAAIAFSLFGAALAFFFSPPQAPSETMWGTLRRDTAWHSPHRSNHQFVLDVEWPFRGPVLVDYEGDWPTTACDGHEVVVDGRFSISGDPRITRVEAETVDGVNMGRYDACWRWRCLGWSPCRRDVMFE